MPPQNQDAEESLVGAMLLSGEAIAAATELVRAGDFYDVGLGHIFAAVEALDARGTPVDVVTVAEELTNRGHLDAAGGMARLVELQVSTPGSSVADEYARIVVDKAHQRRKIAASLEMADAAQLGDGERFNRALEDLTAVDESGPVPIVERESIGDLMRSPGSDIAAELLHLTNGRALLIRGAITIIWAEPAAGKTWLASEALRQCVTAGQNVTVIDHEGTGRSLAQRLNTLGLDPALADRHVTYLHPGAAGSGAIRRAALASEPALVVIDGLAAALAEQDLDEDRAADALKYLRPVARALADAGIAVLVLDHVTKAKDSRGHWGRGSGSKKGEVDTAYMLEVTKPFSKGVDGSVAIRIAKDRHGCIGPQGAMAGHMMVQSTETSMRITLEPSHDPERSDWHGPTECMAAVRKILEDQAGTELAQGRLEDQLRAGGKSFRNQTIREAAERLAQDPAEPITVRVGARSARLYTFDPGAQMLGSDPLDEDF